jgi:outer membrane lipoprotein SlyB
MKTTQVMTASALTALALLGGCANPGYQSGYPQAGQPVYSQPQPQPYPYPVSSQPANSYYSSYGVVDSVQITQAPVSADPGLGAVVGGVVGGLLGNQVGGGTGKTVATVAGVVGGAMVGNQMEQNSRSQTRDLYQIRVRLENGSYQTITQDTAPDLRPGNRVRIENNRVYRY